MKRAVSILLVAVLSFTLFSGCGDKKETGFILFSEFETAYNSALADQDLDALGYKTVDPVNEKDIGKIIVHEARIPQKDSAATGLSGSVSLYCDKKSGQIQNLFVMVYDDVEQLIPYSFCAIQALTPDADAADILKQLLLDHSATGDQTIKGDDGVYYSFRGAEEIFSFMIGRSKS